MAISLPTGTKVSVASTLGTSYAVTAATNAAETVLTVATGHGLTVGDYVVVRSGWSLLDYRVARVKTVATNDVTLEGINTVNLDQYSAGSGVGSIAQQGRTPGEAATEGFQQQQLAALDLARTHCSVQRQRH